MSYYFLPHEIVYEVTTTILGVVLHIFAEATQLTPILRGIRYQSLIAPRIRFFLKQEVKSVGMCGQCSPFFQGLIVQPKVQSSPAKSISFYIKVIR